MTQSENHTTSGTDAASTESAVAMTPSEQGLLCACARLNLNEYRSILAENPEATFEEVLSMTKAGATCTACLLDLEFHFVETAHRTRSGKKGSVASKVADEGRSFKRRLYDLIDGFSPMVPFKLVERLPIISGHGIEQRLWISNRSLLFAGERAAPPYNLEVIIRDQDGRICRTEKRTVEPESSFEWTASADIPAACGDDELSVGSMEIRRSSARPGVRGTTRPQTEILAPNGACSVHAQAYKTAGEKWFTTYHRPEDQRVFLTYISFQDTPLNIELRYPMNVSETGVEPKVSNFEIPPFGSVLTEIELSEEEIGKLGHRILTLNWSSDGEYNCHIFCATRDLSQFSIDHS